MTIIRKAAHVSIKTEDGIRVRQRFQGPNLKMSNASTPTEKWIWVNIYATDELKQQPLSKERLFWTWLITIKQESCQRRDVRLTSEALTAFLNANQNLNKLLSKDRQLVWHLQSQAWLQSAGYHASSARAVRFPELSCLTWHINKVVK